MNAIRSTSLSREYIRLNLMFTSMAFFYLLIGLLIMLFDVFVRFKISQDSIYILWLFGFVGSMIFGITNIMIPSYASRKEFSKSVVTSELILLNLGIITSFIGYNGISAALLFPLGIVLLIFAVLIHIFDLISARKIV